MSGFFCRRKSCGISGREPGRACCCGLNASMTWSVWPGSANWRSIPPTARGWSPIRRISPGWADSVPRPVRCAAVASSRRPPPVRSHASSSAGTGEDSGGGLSVSVVSTRCSTAPRPSAGAFPSPPPFWRTPGVRRRRRAGYAPPHFSRLPGAPASRRPVCKAYSKADAGETPAVPGKRLGHRTPSVTRTAGRRRGWRARGRSATLSRLRTHNQKIKVAAMQMALKKVWAHRS